MKLINIEKEFMIICVKDDKLAEEEENKEAWYTDIYGE